MNSITMIWKKSPAAILLVVASALLALGHFEYKVRTLQNQDIVINVNKPYTEQNFSESEEEYITEINPAETLINNDASDNIFADVRSLYERGEYPAALTSLKQMPDVPENKQDTYLLYAGLIYTRLGEPSSAENQYLKLIELYPGSFAGHYNLGLLYFESARYSTAREIVTNSLKLAGGTARAKSFRLLGRIYLKLELPDSAAENFQEAILLEPADIQSRLYLAEIEWKWKKNYSAAGDYYDKVSRLNPESGELYIGMSEMEMSFGNYTGALEILYEAKPLVQENFGISLAVVKILIEKGDLQSALAECQNLKELYPNQTEPEFQLGRIYYQQRNFSRAEEAFRNSILLSGERSTEALNNLGLSLMSQQRWNEALEIFNEAINTDPLYATAYYNRGLVYLESGDPAGAVESFNQAITSNPDFSNAWYNLGIALAETGNITESINAYEKALLLEPDDLKSRLNLAVQYKRAGAVPAALEQYILVLRLNPEYASAWFNLALLQKSQGNAGDAEKSYRNALKLEPQQITYWLNLSVLLGEQERFSESIALLIESLEIHPDSPELRYNLGLQYKKNNQPEEAMKEWVLVSTISPDFSPVWKSLGYLYSDAGRHEEALIAFRNSIALSEDTYYLEYLLGKEYLALEAPSRALDHFEKALEGISDNAFLWLNIGRAYLKNGENDKSTEAFSSALKLDPKLEKYMRGDLELVDEEGQIYMTRLSEDPYNPLWYIRLSELYMNDNNYVDAEALLQKGLERLPYEQELSMLLADAYEAQGKTEDAEIVYRSLLPSENAEIWYRLALLYSGVQNWNEAEELLKNGLNLDSGHQKSLRLRGEILYELERYSESVESLEKAVRLLPDSGTAWIDLGKAYYRLKDYENSTRAFMEARMYSPDYIWSYIWLGRSLRREKKYEEAENAFLEGSTINKDEEQIWIGLGDLNRDLDKPEKARQFYEHALSLNPTSNTIRRRLESLD